jgi:hypothetical protein
MKISTQFKFILSLVLLTVTSLPTFITAQAYEGYTLYSPLNTRWTYLRDMNNQLVHSWYHNRSGGYSAYLLRDSTVLRSALSTNSPLNGGGATGIVQRCNWAGQLIWEYTYSSSTYRLHHDIEPMPNGNILMIAWEVKTAAQCTQAGLNHSATLWPDHIIEVQPVGTTGGIIVWEWHFWDHLIQDWDPTKDNYGVVADHPELLDINCGSTYGDWTHINGISYNPVLDQIVISSHELDEIYVIDHSTTTQEAAGHSGGNSGMGGDILYRWGRPANYKRTGPQIFNVVHSSVWVADSLPGGGHLMAFNNREGMGSSVVVEIEPPYYNTYNYYIEPNQPFGPAAPYWTFTAGWFYSNHLGGCQRLPNGNTIIAESTAGYLFEVDSLGTVVWSYSAGGQIPRVLRYPLDYLSGTVTNADGNSDDPVITFSLLQNYPNPFNPATSIKYTVGEREFVSLKVFDLLGNEVVVLINEEKSAGEYKIDFDASHLSGGVYFYQLKAGNFAETKKMLLLK